MNGRPIGDEVLVRRAARGVAVQAAALVALAMLLLIVLVTVVMIHGQSGAADDLLRSAVATADDVSDPPAGAWLVMGDSASPGLPADLRPDLTALRTEAANRIQVTTIEDDDGEYRIATGLVKGRPVQAVLDLTSQHKEQARMLQAMGLAAVLSLLLAGLLGVLIGRRAVRPLAQALTLQRAFVANAGHELRTPLTLLSTRAQLLGRSLHRDGASDQVLDDADGVVRDTRRLTEVVDDLLAAADPRRAEEQVPVDLVGLAYDVAEAAGAHAEQVGVRVRAASDRDSAPALGSPSAIRRAAIALVDNAIDHTPRGGEVRIGVRKQRRDVILSVSDTGSGIAPEAAERVLRRFDSSGHRGGRVHYGLGLALAHDVANRFGGQLRLAPSEIGATFELVLPALREDGPRKS
ncbi:sensor histidine kinase [Kribbella sp. WER1]